MCRATVRASSPAESQRLGPDGQSALSGLSQGHIAGCSVSRRMSGQRPRLNRCGTHLWMKVPEPTKQAERARRDLVRNLGVGALTRGPELTGIAAI